MNDLLAKLRDSIKRYGEAAYAHGQYANDWQAVKDLDSIQGEINVILESLAPAGLSDGERDALENVEWAARNGMTPSDEHVACIAPDQHILDYDQQCDGYTLRPLIYGDTHARETRMAQAFPKLSQFFDKHALPSKDAPSCLKCGRTTLPESVSIGHSELPNIVICNDCTHPPQPPRDAMVGDAMVDAGVSAYYEALTVNCFDKREHIRRALTVALSAKGDV